MPLLSAPMLITMSISRAPSRMARRASMALTSVVAAPNGKPITDATATSVPRTLSAARRIQVGLMHTAAKWCSTASAHRRSMSAAVASGRSRVWSMYPARSSGTSLPRPWYAIRLAPLVTTSRTLSAQCAAHDPPQLMHVSPPSENVASTSRVIVSISRSRSSIVVIASQPRCRPSGSAARWR